MFLYTHYVAVAYFFVVCYNYTMDIKKCIVCEKEIIRIPKFGKIEWAGKKYCSRLCKDKGWSLFHSGTNNKKFKGGTISVQGYRILSFGRNNRKYEHRIVMEKFLGRKLTNKEYIHHINENRLDNRIENLKIVSLVEHNHIHYPKGSKFGKNSIKYHTPTA